MKVFEFSLKKFVFVTLPSVYKHRDKKAKFCVEYFHESHVKREIGIINLVLQKFPTVRMVGFIDM